MAAQNPQPDPGQTEVVAEREQRLDDAPLDGARNVPVDRARLEPAVEHPEERIEPIPDQRGLDGEVAEQAAPADPRRHGDVVHAGPVVAAGVEEPHRDERHRGGVDAGRSSPGDLLASLPTHPANYMAPSARIV